MGNPAEERTVFSGFINEEPLFADVAVKGWDLAANDPPDIECDLEDGRRVGVELTSWLDEAQMSSAKGKENLEQPFKKLLKWEPNNTENFRMVWLFAKKRLKKNDEQAFRSELLMLIDQLDKRWPAEADWQSPQAFAWSDFAQYATLKKYLDRLNIYPRMQRATIKGGIGWLTFPCNGGSYSRSMVDALYNCIKGKINKYSAKPTTVNHFYLLAHYDKAFAYNSPVEAINFGYKEAVRSTAERIGPKVGVFEKSFVYVSMSDDQKVFQMYPSA